MGLDEERHETILPAAMKELRVVIPRLDFFPRWATIDTALSQGTIRAVLDSAGTRVSTWRSRDFEAQMLVELLRLSRLTVLYGAEGAGKTTLLKTNVLPLLRGRAPDNRPPQDGKPRVVVPFPDRRVGERTAGSRSPLSSIAGTASRSQP